MLDGLATPIENLGSRLWSRGHAVEHRLILQTRELSVAIGATLPDRTSEARRAVGVVDFLQIPELALIARRKNLPRRADERVQLWIVAEFVLAEKALAHRKSALRFGT